MIVRIPMRECLIDPNIFGRILQGESWYGWRALLIAAAGEALTDDERIEFKRLTGREREPGRMCHELIAIAGRRGGKTLALSVFDCWLAALCDHRDVLAPGETGVALLISRDQRAAKITLDYIDGILGSSPILRSLIANRTQDSIALSNGISIEVRPCNRVSVRGATFVSIVADEVAHWFTSTDFANPDTEVLGSARPGLMTTRGPVLMASSVYAKRGVLFDSFRKYYGPDGPPDILVAYGTSRDFNPSLPQAEIDRELERDPVANRAEYLSEWRIDSEGFISRGIVEDGVGNYYELPPQPKTNYCCFLDSASGVPEGDSFAAVVSHMASDRVTVDAIREVRPPFNYFEVIQSVLVPLCKAYKIYEVVGDNYAGELAKEPVRKAGISFALAEKHKTQLYSDPFLGLLNARRIDLPRNDRAVNQICSLERSLLRTGREQITHPTHGHDDIANAIAGAVDLAYSHIGYDRTYRAFLPDYVDPDAGRQQGSSADTNLRNIYRGIDQAFRFGPPGRLPW